MRTTLAALAAVAIVGLFLLAAHERSEAHTGAIVHTHDHGATFHSHTAFGEHQHRH